ncbi:MAG: septal ring lytic transglycosylase RlpA family protein [Myxococcales bacterium]|nr:septal ring lytic transglycosylase RlpA family protein [Myxococcota bacterium]MDW8284235.1 septal ring lytic transglycosylase RlpA family protein [Myxococcales bacterium]
MDTILSVGKLLLLALLGSAQLKSERGYATRFGGREDMLAGGVMACTGRPMAPGERVCAHRTLPCGTVLLLQSLRTRKVAVCVVADRGPFGATLPNGELVLKLRASEEGRWRGLVDLSPAVAAALELSGREQVSVIWERRPPRRRLQRAAPHPGDALAAAERSASGVVALR